MKMARDNKKMKAAFLEAPNNIILKDIDIPEPKVGEVRIKLPKVVVPKASR
jgi:D-arabinose 1-dehydrogenase-like Zn-dependent alcohol dehydrogenase